MRDRLVPSASLTVDQAQACTSQARSRAGHKDPAHRLAQPRRSRRRLGRCPLLAALRAVVEGPGLLHLALEALLLGRLHSQRHRIPFKTSLQRRETTDQDSSASRKAAAAVTRPRQRKACPSYTCWRQAAASPSSSAAPTQAWASEEQPMLRAAMRGTPPPRWQSWRSRVGGRSRFRDRPRRAAAAKGWRGGR